VVAAATAANSLRPRRAETCHLPFMWDGSSASS
jgi:hypothetical protein